MSVQNELFEFIRGQKDCKEGKEHKSGSEHYDRGYAAEYELEQMNTERTSRDK